MMYKLFHVMTSVLLVILVMSCSGGNNPLAPQDLSGNSEDKLPQLSQKALWGYWDVQFNSETQEFEITRLRSAEFTANVNNLLEIKSGNLLITDLDLTDFFTLGRIDCTVTLKHPFPGLDQYHGFDVWGTFLHNADSTKSYEDIQYSGSGDTNSDVAVLLNADGYTRWFNYPEFSGTGLKLFEFTSGKLANIPAPTAELNPYMIFADGLGLNDEVSDWLKSGSNIDNRLIFRAGQANSRRYKLDFPIIGGSPVVHFQYAVIAGWEPADPTLTGQPNIYDPMDFPASANAQEAFLITADTTASSLFNDGQGASGGTFTADIEVFDWQGGFASNNGVVNEIENLIIEADFLPGGVYVIDSSGLESIASAGTSCSSVFSVDIPGCDPDFTSAQDYWVSVETDKTYDQGFPTAFPTATLAAYYRGSVSVSDQVPGNLIVSSINPNTAPFWGSVDDAVITGIGFENGCTVELRKGTDVVNGTNVIFNSSSSITCDFDFTGKDSGVYDVVVINPSTLEGILDDGFTITPWADEETLDVAGNRLPQMAETEDGSAVILFGCNDNNVRYIPFVENVGWGSTDIAVAGSPGHTHLTLTSDPVNGNVYFVDYLQLYRYTGNTGLWDHRDPGYGSALSMILVADQNGKLNLLHNSINAWGHINHARFASWTGPYELYLDNVMDGWNINYVSQSNVVAQNSAGRIFLAYERDWWFNQYGQQQPGPRWVKVAWFDLNGMFSYNYSEIDQAFNMDPLDTPSITCDSSDVLHAAYRKWIPATSQWQVAYKKSTTNGSSWTAPAVIYQGTTAPEKGYLYIMADSNNGLHCVYNLDGKIYYKSSSDGVNWSTAEMVNESITGLPGTDDWTIRMLVTSDGIMHVAWTRGTKSTGWGDIRHRMRDLY